MNEDLILMFSFCAAISLYFMITLNYFISLVLLLLYPVEIHFCAKNEGMDSYFTLFSF